MHWLARVYLYSCEWNQVNACVDRWYWGSVTEVWKHLEVITMSGLVPVSQLFSLYVWASWSIGKGGT